MMEFWGQIVSVSTIMLVASPRMMPSCIIDWRWRVSSEGKVIMVKCRQVLLEVVV